MEPPLTWMIDGDAVRNTSSLFTFKAADADLRELALYGSVERVESLSAYVRVSPLSRGRYSVKGTLSAEIVQRSVISGEPVKNSVRDEFAVEYWPPEIFDDYKDEAASDDAEALVNGTMPIGALISELFSVAIEPYPRLDGEAFDEYIERPRAEASPFGQLAVLKIPKTKTE